MIQTATHSCINYLWIAKVRKDRETGFCFFDYEYGAENLLLFSCHLFAK